MKKIFSIAFLLLVVVLIIGCIQPTTKTTTSKTTSKTPSATAGLAVDINVSAIDDLEKEIDATTDIDEIDKMLKELE